MRANLGRPFWADDPPALVVRMRAALRINPALSCKERSIQRDLYACGSSLRPKTLISLSKTATLLSLSRCTKVRFAQELTGSQTPLDR